MSLLVKLKYNPKIVVGVDIDQRLIKQAIKNLNEVAFDASARETFEREQEKQEQEDAGQSMPIDTQSAEQAERE